MNKPLSLAEQQKIVAEAEYAQRFLLSYYFAWNTGRKELLHRLYSQTSKLLWNGLVYQGADIINLFDKIYQQMCFTSFDYQVIDDTHMLLTSFGMLALDNDPTTARMFSHQFVIEASKANPQQQQVTTIILSENFRWVVKVDSELFKQEFGKYENTQNNTMGNIV
ncbi:hypothetical protein C9374_007230 [Naegleria lovaniensis]|uniref:NTF2 domain-containing protein n=1 Tax=Naegleria lovaniensis TaxID=51637 RepID=A0AA88KSI0_NAELO|nr:uncharacterized protein C9374_007230 [Naegleria lovaniensis]KAG2393699.1 hypothetical protein C9374_007230 [Naegleria lovaniensis]